MYVRGRTLFDHQQIAQETLGFQWMTEHQRRAFVRVMRDEVTRLSDKAQLLTFGRRWLYDHKLLIEHDRALRSQIDAALDLLEPRLSIRARDDGEGIFEAVGTLVRSP